MTLGQPLTFHTQLLPEGPFLLQHDLQKRETDRPHAGIKMGCLSQVICPFIQHSLSACHEKAPAEARLPKAIRVLPQELSNRREKSHMATEGQGPLCSKGRTSSGPHPTTVHAEAWVRIGHHIFGEQGHIECSPAEIRVKLRRLRCLSKSAYIL